MIPRTRPSLFHRSIALPHPEATTDLGAQLAGILQPGDCILLSGPIGAGKSHLTRAAIRALMEKHGEAPEDIPSPTYTLVQTYPAGQTEIWHADLYRLTDPTEVMELGLDEAFLTGICFVEWPDRLGSDAPPEALSISLGEAGDGRIATLSGDKARWERRISVLNAAMKDCDDPRS